MLSLYRIKHDYLNAFRELSQVEEFTEVMIKDSLAIIEDQFDEKAIAVAAYIKNVEAEADALKEHIRKLENRKNNMLSGVRKLKNYLVQNMEGLNKSRIKGEELDIGLRHNAPTLRRDYTIEIDPKFIKTIQMQKEDDEAIKAALENGEEVKGATLVSTTSLVIKT